jgi:hypothetical protein
MSDTARLSWRKSSYSSANGGNCVEVGQLGWRKSSHSGANGGNCVEVADHDDAIVVRDTTDHGHGPVHRFTSSDWRAFVASVKATGRLACPSSALEVRRLRGRTSAVMIMILNSPLRTTAWYRSGYDQALLLLADQSGLMCSPGLWPVFSVSSPGVASCWA